MTERSTITNSLAHDAFAPLWETEKPDFVNPEGVKWWLDKSTTRYATKENLNGTKLDYQVFIVQKPDGYLTRIILDENREPIFESQQLETIGFEIDKLKLIKERF